MGLHFLTRTSLKITAAPAPAQAKITTIRRIIRGPRPTGFRRSNLAALAILAPCLFAFAARSTRAGELDAFVGTLESNNSGVETYTWGIEYREPLTDHLNASFLWLNEGHLPNNHRDGQAVQLWWHSLPNSIGLVFEAGVGPYRYYDTHTFPIDPEFRDAHGWGAVASAEIDWYLASHWFTFLRLNQVETSNKYGSSSLALGAGYQFASTPDFSPGTGENPRWEIDGLLGERIGNTAHSETGMSEGISARAMLTSHWTASVTFIAGQGTLLDWRSGIAAQLWLEQQLTSRFRVGAGAGAFMVSEDDNLQNASSPSHLAAMVSVTVACSLTSHWVARVVWDRIGTGDDHDADILHFGVGYKF